MNTWRTWVDDDALVHVIEVPPHAAPILYCYQTVMRFTARHELGLETLDTTDRTVTCLLCAAWWRPS